VISIVDLPRAKRRGWGPVNVVSMASVRARRVDADRVQTLLLARSVPLLHETAVTLARDGLLADWAAIIDRSGAALATTSLDHVGRGPLLAALAWGSVRDATDTVSVALITGFDAALVTCRRSSSMGSGERERLAVLAGIVGVVWGHLRDGGDDRGRDPIAPRRPAAV
jgi:hypothetical protein